MKWTDAFWTAYNFTVDTVINTTSYALNGIGTIACAVGGLAFPLTYVMDDTLTASYSGVANTTGKVNVGVDIQEFNYSINGSIPFKKILEKNDGMTYKLQEYIQPGTIQMASLILVASGTLLKIFGDNIKLWQQGRADKERVKERYRIECKNPQLKEHLYITGKSITESLSYSMIACTTSGLIIKITEIIGSSMNFTYPSKGEGWVTTPHYTGPVDSSLIPVEYTLDQNNTVKLPIIDMNVSVEEKVQAIATINATYGGGLFFQSHDTNNFPSYIPGVIGFLACNTSRFFSRKATELRDDRLTEARDLSYSLIPN